MQRKPNWENKIVPMLMGNQWWLFLWKWTWQRSTWALAKRQTITMIKSTIHPTCRTIIRLCRDLVSKSRQRTRCTRVNVSSRQRLIDTKSIGQCLQATSFIATGRKVIQTTELCTQWLVPSSKRCQMSSVTQKTAASTQSRSFSLQTSLVSSISSRKTLKTSG